MHEITLSIHSFIFVKKSSLQVCSDSFVGFSCESGFRRQRRSIDVQKELAQKGYNMRVFYILHFYMHNKVCVTSQLPRGKNQQGLYTGDICEEVK